MRENRPLKDDGAPFSRNEFAEILMMLHQMREAERRRFASDPQNAQVLRNYNRHCDRLRLLFISPLIALLVFSIAAGIVLGTP